VPRLIRCSWGLELFVHLFFDAATFRHLSPFTVQSCCIHELMRFLMRALLHQSAVRIPECADPLGSGDASIGNLETSPPQTGSCASDGPQKGGQGLRNKHKSGLTPPSGRQAGTCASLKLPEAGRSTANVITAPSAPTAIMCASSTENLSDIRCDEMMP